MSIVPPKRHEFVAMRRLMERSFGRYESGASRGARSAASSGRGQIVVSSDAVDSRPRLRQSARCGRSAVTTRATSARWSCARNHPDCTGEPDARARRTRKSHRLPNTSPTSLPRRTGGQQRRSLQPSWRACCRFDFTTPAGRPCSTRPPPTGADHLVPGIHRPSPMASSDSGSGRRGRRVGVTVVISRRIRMSRSPGPERGGLVRRGRGGGGRARRRRARCHRAGSSPSGRASSGSAAIRLPGHAGV